MTAAVAHLPTASAAPVEQPQGFTSVQMCVDAGCTFRQLDVWTRTHLIPGVDEALAPGSGRPRYWTAEQREFVIYLTRLVKAGLNPRVAGEALIAQASGGVLPDVLRLPGGAELRLLQSDAEAVS